MNINFSGKFKNLKGEDSEHLIADEIANCLVNLTQEEVNNLSARDKIGRYSLAKKVLNSTDDGENYSVDDVSIIKKIVGAKCLPIAVAQIYEIIEVSEKN